MRGIQTGIQMTAELANIDPTALDTIDMDRVQEHIFDASGFPTDCIRNQSERDNIRKIRIENQKAMQQAELMVKYGKAASLAGKGADPSSMMGKLMGNEEGANA
jgi:hypothetical protein